MTEFEGYQGSLPEEVAEHVHFLSGLIIVVLAFVLKRIGLIKAEHIPGLQVAAFTFCLPAMMLGILWRVKIESSLLVVMGIASATHVIWIFIVQLIVRFVAEEDKGVYSMALAVHSMAYVYPVLMHCERFGVDAFPIVAMWELGGASWSSNIYYAIASHVFRIRGTQEDGIAVATKPMRKPPSFGTALALAARARDASIVTVRQGSGIDSNSVDADMMPVMPNNSEEPPRAIESEMGGALEDIMALEANADGVRARTVVETTPIDTQILGKAAMTNKTPIDSSLPLTPDFCQRLCSLLLPVLRNPVIWACVLGLTLNICQVPYYVLPGKAIDSLMGAFSPFLFALLGANLNFGLGLRGYGRVLKLLSVRYLLSLPLMFVFRSCLPLPRMQRSVLSLIMLAPIPGTFIMFSSINGFKMDEVVMAYNLSATTSLVALNLLVDVV